MATSPENRLARRILLCLLTVVDPASEGYRLLDGAYWHLAGKADWKPCGSRLF